MQEYYIRIKIACNSERLAKDMQEFAVEGLKDRPLLPHEFQVLDGQLLEVDKQ